MEKKIRVAIYGVGPIGAKIAGFLYERKNFEVAGAIDIAENKKGKDLAEFAGLEKKTGVLIESDAGKVLSGKNIDAVVLATASSIAKIKGQVAGILSYGINIVSTCEELSYPWVTAPGTAKEIDALAKKNNAVVLSTGVNPGFLMDFLPIAMSGVCRNVERITVERVQNAAERRIPFQQKVGIGITPEEFTNRVKEGTLKHVGLTESMHMIAGRMGWTLDRTEDVIEPVIAQELLTVNGKVIDKGMVLGVKQTGRGFSEKKELITLTFTAAAGISPAYDRTVIKGTPEMDVTIKNGVNGDIATCAIIANAIPVVLRAKPGLRTMSDIEPVSFFAG
ncbi:MAG: Gfo/Idh/MocA family oxidoreductase [Candidatus Omnitrophica bacterium]|nr:Gfo/Idh/MocA family oxidoreductase [Candidatus Omnitrophota bacterium]